MKKNTELMEPDSNYHVFNRGVNGENLFIDNKNYSYFLDKYLKYIEPIANSFAYCLMKNHFHFAINTKSEQEIVDYYKSSHPNSIIIPAPQIIIGKQFSHLFNGYSQAINKSYNRTGALFEQPFRRIHFDNESYLCELIRYIHRNPQNHKIIQDFREYLHSSFNSILSDRPTKLLRNEVFALFGGVDKFRLIHENDNLNNLDKYDIE